jgi:hypothetical protein
LPPDFSEVRHAWPFTHIYTARRVADHLLTGNFPDWPQAGSALLKHDPAACGTVMKKWEKFTAIGAIGPDLFLLLSALQRTAVGAGQR